MNMDIMTAASAYQSTAYAVQSNQSKEQNVLKESKQTKQMKDEVQLSEEGKKRLQMIRKKNPMTWQRS